MMPVDSQEKEPYNVKSLRSSASVSTRGTRCSIIRVVQAVSSFLLSCHSVQRECDSLLFRYLRVGDGERKAKTRRKPSEAEERQVGSHGSEGHSELNTPTSCGTLFSSSHTIQRQSLCLLPYTRLLERINDSADDVPERFASDFQLQLISNFVPRFFST
ncbi:hypothetical protein SCHPADRAFT_647335 [Schizopora paradoxa]|uniref:Uncharacterized protein n=1 Tax=Schizopora paradoxa TaxID=27342 RepID=A0A0H2RDB2_9AGAM|nr:hypothetical protein SCHPADRAFT_647335 [Schizopora paradoxa]